MISRFDNNPYLSADFSSPKRGKSTVTSSRLKPLGFGVSSHLKSSSLVQLVDQLEQKAQDDDQHFAVNVK